MLPGFTTTPMTDIVPDKVKEYFKSTIPMNRFADSDGKYCWIVDYNFLELNTF